MSEASARWTGARQLTAAVLILGGPLASACSIEQPVSGPIALTREWTTVDPPKPLSVAGKYEQKVCLQLNGTVTDMDLQNGVVLGGTRHLIEGEATDDAQTKYTLKVAERGGNNVCLYNAADSPPGPDFPEDRTIVRLRLRSEPPIQVNQVSWHSYDPH